MEENKIGKIKYKKLKENAIEPTRGTKKSAGYDLYATEGATIKAHETVKIGTGLAFELPDGTFGAVFARSGLATKQGLRPANCVAVIDSDYRGEVMVPLHNDSKKKKTIEKGERVAQLVVMPYYSFTLKEVNELSSTERGEGGFGSTGMK